MILQDASSTPLWSRCGTVSCERRFRCRIKVTCKVTSDGGHDAQVYFCDSIELPCAMSSFFVFTSIGFAIQQGTVEFLRSGNVTLESFRDQPCLFRAACRSVCFPFVLLHRSRNAPNAYLQICAVLRSLSVLSSLSSSLLLTSLRFRLAQCKSFVILGRLTDLCRLFHVVPSPARLLDRSQRR